MKRQPPLARGVCYRVRWADILILRDTGWRPGKKGFAPHAPLFEFDGWYLCTERGIAIFKMERGLKKGYEMYEGAGAGGEKQMIPVGCILDVRRVELGPVVWRNRLYNGLVSPNGRQT